MIRSSLIVLIGILNLSLPQTPLQQPAGSGAGRVPVASSASGSQPIQLGGAVPQGFMILGENSNSPPGYTFNGDYLTVRTGENPSWSSGPSMPGGMYRPAVVQVGTDIYVLGGSNGSYLNTVWKLESETNTWTLETTMPTPREGLFAAEVGGKIYAIGGEVSTNVPTAVVEAYDLGSQTWDNPPPTPLPSARAYLTGGVVNGRIYAIGGTAGAAVQNLNQEYDPASNTWTSRASMLTPRGASAGATLNGRIFVIGGWSGSAYVGTNEAYDPATNSWKPKASMLNPRGFLGVAHANARIYAMGGQQSGSILWTDVVEEYEPLYDHWTQIQPMTTARSLLGAAAPSGKVMAIGGLAAAGYSPTVDVYCPGFRMLFAHRKN